MKTCPQCGFHHVDLDERCALCGTLLDPISPVKTDENLEDRLREKLNFKASETPGWRWNLPHRILAAFRRWRYFTAQALASDLPENVYQRNPWRAGFLSLIPGLGQLYNHQPKKALMILIAVAASFTAALATLKWHYSNYVLLILFLAEVYSFHDALVTAKRINRDYFIWQHGVAFYCAWILYVALFCFIFQWATAYFLLQFRYISYNVLSPHLRQGDRILVDMVSRPKVGDIIYYSPRPITIELTAGAEAAIDLPVYIIHPKSMIERIVAEPGQTFERRDGIFYRDGKPVPLDEEPLLPDFLPPDINMTAPKGDYLVMFSYTFGKDYLYALNPDIGTVETPKLNKKGGNSLHYVVHDWPEACIVHPGEITGRVVLIYNPPEHRRVMD